MKKVFDIRRELINKALRADGLNKNLSVRMVLSFLKILVEIRKKRKTGFDKKVDRDMEMVHKEISGE